MTDYCKTIQKLFGPTVTKVSYDPNEDEYHWGGCYRINGKRYFVDFDTDSSADPPLQEKIKIFNNYLLVVHRHQYRRERSIDDE